jgi:hypothetical protein
MRLVEGYLEAAGNIENVRSFDRSPDRLFSVPLYALVGESIAACTSDETARAQHHLD